MRDVKPLLEKLLENSELKVFINLLDYFEKEELYLTQNSICEMSSIYVSCELYELVKFELDNLKIEVL